jgi:hypothetical protein
VSLVRDERLLGEHRTLLPAVRVLSWTKER